MGGSSNMGMKPVRKKHIGVTPLYLYKAVVFDHLTGKDLGLPDATKEELLRAIKEDPREVICSCDCKKDERGACTGESA